MLRAELEAATDRAHKAAIQYEIGHITETELAQEAQAVREYLGAYNVDPTFHPPLIALVRIFERRRSFKNLQRLYEAELKSARSPIELASARVVWAPSGPQSTIVSAYRSAGPGKEQPAA